MPDHLKCIIFDFDGVLVDSVHIKGEAFSLLYASEGRSIQNLMRQYHEDNGGMPRREKIINFETKVLGRELSAERLNALLDKFAQTVKEQVIACRSIKGADNFLASFNPHIPRYIVSATPSNELLEIIEARNLSQYFQGVFGSHKNKSEHIHDILSNLNLLPNEAIMIGDAIADLEAARKTNVHFLGRRDDKNDDFFSKEVHIIENLEFLAPYLESNFIIRA